MKNGTFDHLILMLFLQSLLTLPLYSEPYGQDRERLKKIVSRFVETKEQQLAILEALKEAAAKKFIDVLEVGLNNPLRSANAEALDYLCDAGIPKAELQKILLSALQNPSIWPDPESDKTITIRDGATNAAMFGRQAGFCGVLSETFGVLVDHTSFKGLWTARQRMELVKSLGGAVPSLANPENARRIVGRTDGEIGRPASSKIGESNSPGSIAAVANQELSRVPGSWFSWVGGAACFGAVGCWIVARIRSRETKENRN